MLHYTNMANTVGTIFEKINKNKGVNASLYSLLTAPSVPPNGWVFWVQPIKKTLKTKNKNYSQSLAKHQVNYKLYDYVN